MFDISFGELLVVGVVALVVIGPERLPKVARTLGSMVGRLQRYVAGVKADIQREIDLDSLRQIEAEMNEAGRKMHQQLNGELKEVNHDLQGVLGEARDAAADQAALAAGTPDVPQFDLFAPPTTTTPPLEIAPISPLPEPAAQSSAVRDRR